MLSARKPTIIKELLNVDSPKGNKKTWFSPTKSSKKIIAQTPKTPIMSSRKVTDVDLNATTKTNGDKTIIDEGVTLITPRVSISPRASHSPREKRDVKNIVLNEAKNVSVSLCCGYILF